MTNRRSTEERQRDGSKGVRSGVTYRVERKCAATVMV